MYSTSQQNQQLPPATPYQPFPPGVAGELAQFIYQSSPYPMAEAATACALGILGGILGKVFVVQNYGLCIRLVGISGSVHGEDAVQRGAVRLVAAMAPSCPEITLFISYKSFTNGVALRGALALRPSFVNMVGNRIAWLAGIAGSSARAVGVREAMGSLYMFDGAGYSVVVESTTRDIQRLLKPSLLKEDFLHSFILSECTDFRPPWKPHSVGVAIPYGLRDKLGCLCRVAAVGMTSGRLTDVSIDAEARLLFSSFNTHCDAVINGSDDDAVRLLWGCAQEKAMRVAALLAVADNCETPCVNPAHARWACDFVWHGTGVVMRHAKFDQPRAAA